MCIYMYHDDDGKQCLPQDVRASFEESYNWGKAELFYLIFFSSFFHFLGWGEGFWILGRRKELLWVIQPFWLSFSFSFSLFLLLSSPLSPSVFPSYGLILFQQHAVTDLEGVASILVLWTDEYEKLRSRKRRTHRDSVALNQEYIKIQRCVISRFHISTIMICSL